MLCREIVGVMVLVVVAFIPQLSESARETLNIPVDANCACPGSILTYRCTAVGIGSTQWIGTALDCTNALILRHNRFKSENISGRCNNGAIVGRSLEVVDDNCYISQLTVNISVNLDNKTVQCIHNSDVGSNVVGTSNLTVLKAPYKAPSGLRLAHAEMGKLTFSWSPPSSTCSPTSYGIISDCGNCSRSTTYLTTAICSELHLMSDTVDNVCTLSVYSMFCNDIIENPVTSDSVIVTLRVPRPPELVIIPVYLGENQEITKLMVAINQSVTQDFLIAGNISGSVTEYNIYLNSLDVLSKIKMSSCMDSACEKFINIPPCVSSMNINITVSAANILGEGPSSQPAIIGCTNQFVQVDYDAIASTLSCTFLKWQNSVKLCHVQYGPCNQKLTLTDEGTTTSDVVTLNISVLSSASAESFCYIIMATDGSYTILVEGRIIGISDGDRQYIAAVIAPLVFIVVAALIITVLVVTFILRRKIKKEKSYAVELRQYSEDTKVVKIPEMQVGSQLQLKKVDLEERVFITCTVPEDCTLKEFFEHYINVDYERGRAFYEFLEKENISADKELILLCTITRMFFYPNVDQNTLYMHSLLGEGLFPPSLKNYRVFVQSTGPGSRHLPKDSMVLYEQRQPLPVHPLIRVDTRHIGKKSVDEDITLEDFCQKFGDDYKNGIFFEADLHSAINCANIYDVILMDKDSRKLFTGLAAKKMVIEHYCQSLAIDSKHWRVFLLGDFANEVLKQDTLVLYPLRVVSVQNEERGSTPSLICVDSEPFMISKKKHSCKLESFRKMYGLEAGVYNIFAEVPIGYKHNKTSPILDIIVVDEATGEYYTGYSSLKHVEMTTDNMKQPIKTCGEQKHAEKTSDKEPIKKGKECTKLIGKNRENTSKHHYEDEREHKDFIQFGCPIASEPTEQEHWRIFILKEGMQRLKNTHVLYRVKKEMQIFDKLLKIYSKHFSSVLVKSGAKVKDLQREYRDDNLFLELGVMKGQKLTIKNPVDVILMNEESNELFSGPSARHIVDSNLNCLQTFDRDKWRVYVHCKSLEDLMLTSSGSILCQNAKYNGGEFYVLKVTKQNVRMSHFIEETFKEPFKNGAIFCELTEEGDDLLSYKEVVHVSLDLLNLLEDNMKEWLLKAPFVASMVLVKCLEPKTHCFFAIYDILTALATR